MFLAAGAAIVLGACSGDDATSPPSAVVDVPDPTFASAPDATAASTTPPSTPSTTSPPTTLPPIDLSADPFTLGVASGDPTPRSVVLWTRLAPDPLHGGGMPDQDVAVVWEVATDAAFATLVGSGTDTARSQYAHTVHVEAQLEAAPGAALHYRFRAGQYTSPTGITRLAPPADQAVDTCNFVSASCQHYESGFYVVHHEIADKQPDFVVFLGDYIYEGGAGTVGQNDNVRTHGTDTCTTLDDYRNRYALYKGDADLQAAHAACPWLVTWDDHEVANNYAGPSVDADRRAAAYQAWWEHQPVALPPPVDGQDFTIYRSFTWGSLLTVAVLDGRQYRSDQTCGGQTLNLDPACPETFEQSRTMLGDQQEQWLMDVLNASATTWNVIAQQTVFGDVTLGDAVLNYDQWDGYPAERNTIVSWLGSHAIDNVVVLTGDIHFAGAGIIRAGGRGTGVPVAVELVATSVSSGGRIDPAVTEVVKAIPDIVDVELEHRGYIGHAVTAPAWDAVYRMADTVKEPTSALFQHARYRIEAGTNLVGIAEGLTRD
jgi:alkaline phosphatase D